MFSACSYEYKKVLLRERKRHTARRVVSTPSVVLPGYPPPPGGGGGYPNLGTPPPPGGYPDLGTPPGGTRTSVPPGGYPDLGTPPRGYPDLSTPPPPGGGGGTRTSVPPPGGGLGTPPGCLMAFWEMLQSIMGYGYPPLWTDRLMDGQTRVKTLPSLVLRTRAVNIIKEIEVRYQKALANNSKSYRYVLRLKLCSFEGVRNQFYDYAYDKADELEQLQLQLYNAHGIMWDDTLERDTDDEGEDDEESS